MRVIDTIAEMQQQANTWRREGLRIGFVPTMGYFHEGHLALMRHARKRSDRVVVSIFVNPTQFGPNEDFDRYPRDMERDLKLAAQIPVDVVFAPTVEEMYPERYQTYVEVMDITQPLCGAKRPGHFRGVTTVVAKLFHIVKPHVAIFGEKDYQQLVVIKRMVADLNMPIEIVPMPTVREPDGLAMSSRNWYLTPEERKVAPALYRALKKAAEAVQAGATGREAEEIVKRELEKVPQFELQYVEAVHPETLEPVDKPPMVIAAAAFLGKARLIDNIKVV